VSTGSLDPDRLLTEGCTLYDMGQIEDALRKWEQVLVLAPTHTLARGYASGARRELGLPPLPDSAVPTPAQPEARLADEDADKLMREAVQLYDMGLAEEAISKWERVLVLEPHRQEVEGYLKMARREVSQVPAPPTVPTRSAVPEPDSLDLKLRQAEHLLTLQRHEEAAFTFQQALRLSPGDARALQGLERCRKPSTGPSQDHTLVIRTPAPAMVLDSRGRIAMADEDSHPPVQTDGQGIEPPAALLKAAPAPREGLSLPNRFREATEHLHWLKHPKVLAILGGSLLVLAVGASLLHGYRKDQALREQVLAARAAALAPVAQQAQAPDLSESMEALREEADLALVSDPLRAFLRAQTLVARSPGDAAGALLLEKARAGLPGGVTGSSLAEFQKHLQNGDLEAALKVMDALLRAQPDNAELKARAGRLHLALCVAHAGQAKWDEAREDLLRGRALFPSDKTWQIRFKLLERIKTMPKAEQASWISLLG
jgi:tetratricopeptide (TPR) repeat protein